MADRDPPDDDDRVVSFPARGQASKTAAAAKNARAPDPDDDDEEDDEWSQAAAKGRVKGGLGSKDETKQADIMVSYVSASDLFRDTGGVACVDIDVDGHRETWPVKSAAFRNWLVGKFFDQRGTVPAAQGATGAIATIEALASRGVMRTLSVRSCVVGDRIFVDMGDDKWRVIEVTPTGWKILDQAPGEVRFRRTPNMKALPEPLPGGSLEQLHSLFHFAEDSDFRLAVVWELAALRGLGGYPPLILNGEAGTAKTTTATALRTLIDPARAEVRAMPANERDMAIAAAGQHVLAIDNISYLPKSLSDALCQLSTGGAFATRTLYTDDGEQIFDAVKPVILAGIEDFVRRGDLASRSVSLTLGRIADADRLSEEAFKVRLQQVAPQALGFLLDIAAAGLKHLPAVAAEVKPESRMVNFILWAAACERGLEGMLLGDIFTPTWKRGDVLADYEANRDASDRSLLEGDPVARSVQRMPTRAYPPKEANAKGLCAGWKQGVEKGSLEWSGTVTELLGEMEKVASQRVLRSSQWPGNATSLGGKLRRAAPLLLSVGVIVDLNMRLDRSNGRGVRVAFSAGAVERAKGIEVSDGEVPF